MRAFPATLLLAVTFAGCARLSATPCDAIGHRTSVITPAEYHACASAIMQALDALRPEALAFVRGDPGARSKALAAHGTLARLLTRAGVQRDIGGELYAPGRLEERWPDRRLMTFNSAAWEASFGYHTALETGEHLPSTYHEEYFDKGSGAHDEAQRAYEELW